MHNTLLRKKILITGGTGFLGSHVVRKMLQKGFSLSNIIVPRSKQFDLKKQSVCRKLLCGVDVVIHLAANVGGIGYNQKYPGSLFYDNILMGVQMMEEARKNGVEKFVALGTICAYPKFTPIPFKEEN